MAFIYHERQLGGLCGVHCLNNLLQGPHFGPGDLAEIGVQLDDQERQLLEGGGEAGEAAAAAAAEGSPAEGGASSSAGGAASSSSAGGLEGRAYNVDPSADGGNFSIQVLVVALQKFGLQLLPAKHPQGQRLMQDPDAATGAFLCQCRDHWFAVRKVADCWWNLNSTRKKPAMVGPFYLAAWLAQLSAEGYSIFLVLGDTMPEPMKPADPEKPEENFHEIFDLLEEAKASGGNPLAGGGDEVDEADARAARALQDEEDARELAALQREFGGPSPPPDRGSPSGTLYEEMLRAQLQMRDRRRAPHQVHEVVEYPAGGGSSWSGDRAQPPPAGGGGLFQELLNALRGCPCQFMPEETSQVTVEPAQSPARYCEATVPYQAPSSAASTPPRRPPARSPGSFEVPELPSEQALRDMGFKEPLVRVAQALAHGRRGSSLAFQLLLRVPTVEQEVENSPERLARAVQEVVLSCDTETEAAFAERLVHAVALLSVDEAKLRAAQEHLNTKALLEFLQSVMRNHGKDWSEEVQEAAALVVHLLEAFPGGAAAMAAEARRSRPLPEGVAAEAGQDSYVQL